MKTLTTLLIFAAATATLAEDWPTQGHDNRRSGISSEQLDTSALTQAWVWTSPVKPQPAWRGTARWDAYNYIEGNKSMRAYDQAFNISAADGKLFIASNAESATIALDASDGSEAWRAFAEAPVRIAPTFDAGRVYFGSDDGFVRCVSATNGSPIWNYRANPDRKLIPNDGRFVSLYACRTGVMVEAGKAYAGFGLVPWEAHYMACLDATTGSQSYKTTLNLTGSREHTLEGALLSSGGKLIAPQGRISPVAFDISTGARQGRIEGGGGSFAIVTNDGRLLAGPGFGNSTYAKSRTNFMQETTISSNSAVVRHPDAHGVVATASRFFFLVKDKVRAVDRSGGNTVWSATVENTQSIVMGGTTLFVGGKDRVAAFDSATGTELWSAAAEGDVYAMAIANGRLFASTSRGKVFCWE